MIRFLPLLLNCSVLVAFSLAVQPPNNQNTPRNVPPRPPGQRANPPGTGDQRMDSQRISPGAIGVLDLDQQALMNRMSSHSGHQQGTGNGRLLPSGSTPNLRALGQDQNNNNNAEDLMARVRMGSQNSGGGLPPNAAFTGSGGLRFGGRAASVAANLHQLGSMAPNRSNAEEMMERAQRMISRHKSSANLQQLAGALPALSSPAQNTDADFGQAAAQNNRLMEEMLAKYGTGTSSGHQPNHGSLTLDSSPSNMNPFGGQGNTSQQSNAFGQAAEENNRLMEQMLANIGAGTSSALQNHHGFGDQSNSGQQSNAFGQVDASGVGRAEAENNRLVEQMLAQFGMNAHQQSQSDAAMALDAMPPLNPFGGQGNPVQQSNPFAFPEAQMDVDSLRQMMLNNANEAHMTHQHMDLDQVADQTAQQHPIDTHQADQSQLNAEQIQQILNSVNSGNFDADQLQQMLNSFSHEGNPNDPNNVSNQFIGQTTHFGANQQQLHQFNVPSQVGHNDAFGSFMNPGQHQGHREQQQQWPPLGLRQSQSPEDMLRTYYSQQQSTPSQNAGPPPEGVSLIDSYEFELPAVANNLAAQRAQAEAMAAAQLAQQQRQHQMTVAQQNPRSRGQQQQRMGVPGMGPRSPVQRQQSTHSQSYAPSQRFAAPRQQPEIEQTQEDVFDAATQAEIARIERQFEATEREEAANERQMDERYSENRETALKLMSHLGECKDELLDQCRMDVFDALTKLEHRQRYETLVHYCNEHRVSLNFCEHPNGGSGCDKIEDVYDKELPEGIDKLPTIKRRELEQRAAITIERMRKQLDLFQSCVKRLLHPGQRHGLNPHSVRGITGSHKFVDLFESVLLPRPLFLALQLRNAMLEDKDKGWRRDARVLLEIAATQSNESLRRVMFISRVLGHPTLAEVPPFIGYQSKSQVLGLQIEQFVKHRLYGTPLASGGGNSQFATMQQNKEFAFSALVLAIRDDAKKMRDAMKGRKNDLSTLIDVIPLRHSTRLKNIKVAYLQLYGRPLEDRIKSECALDPKLGQVLNKILQWDDSQNDRPTNSNRAWEQAKKLFHDGEGTMGTKESTFINMFTGETPNQLREIFRAYKERSLEWAILKEFATSNSPISDERNLRDSLLAILRMANGAGFSSDASFYPDDDALALHKAFDGAGYKADRVIEIMTKRSHEQLKRIDAAYNREYSSDKHKVNLGLIKFKTGDLTLSERIIRETKGDFETFLITLLKHPRKSEPPNRIYAKELARKLYKAGEGKWGTKESVFANIFAKESLEQLRMVFEEYAELPENKDRILKALDKEFRVGLFGDGNLKRVLVDIVNRVWNIEAYNKMEEPLIPLNDMFTSAELDATKFWNAVKGWGTDEDTLIWLLVCRNNAQIMAIGQAYQLLYGHNLETDVKNDTSGKFQKLLMSLMAANRKNADEFVRNKNLEETHARQLCQAGVMRVGVDEETFIQIMTKEHVEHLRGVFDAYFDVCKSAESTVSQTIEEALASEFSGHTLRGLLAIVALVREGPFGVEKLLFKEQEEKSKIKKFFGLFKSIFKTFKPISETEFTHFKNFQMQCEDVPDRERCIREAGGNVIRENDQRRELREQYFSDKIHESLKYNWRSATRKKAQRDLHRILVSRFQHDLVEIMRGVNRLALAHIIDKRKKWHFSLHRFIVKGDPVYTHALKRLLHIENGMQMTGYDDFLKHYGENVGKLMDMIQRNQFEFEVGLRKKSEEEKREEKKKKEEQDKKAKKNDKKGEDKDSNELKLVASVTAKVEALNPQQQQAQQPQDPVDPEDQPDEDTEGLYTAPSAEEEENSSSQKLSNSVFLSDLLDTMSQDLIDRLDLMFVKHMYELHEGKQVDKSWGQKSKKEKRRWSGDQLEWKQYGHLDTMSKGTIHDMNTELYKSHLQVFSFLFVARLYALAIALQKVARRQKGDPPKIPVYHKGSESEECPICLQDFEEGEPVVEAHPPEGAENKHLFHEHCLLKWGKSCPLCRKPVTYTKRVEPMEMERSLKFGIDVPAYAWPPELEKELHKRRQEFEAKFAEHERLMVKEHNFQFEITTIGGKREQRYYQVAYEVLHKLGYFEENKSLRDVMVAEMEHMLEEVNNQLNNNSDEFFAMEQIQFTQHDLNLFGKEKSKMTLLERILNKLFNWLCTLVEKFHKKSLTKRNRMQRFLFGKMHGFVQKLRGLFTGQTPPIKFLFRTFFPMGYYGAKYGKKLFVKCKKLLLSLWNLAKNRNEQKFFKPPSQEELDAKHTFFSVVDDLDEAFTKQDEQQAVLGWAQRADQGAPEQTGETWDSLAGPSGKWTREFKSNRAHREGEGAEEEADLRFTEVLKDNLNMSRWAFDQNPAIQEERERRTMAASGGGRGKREVVIQPQMEVSNDTENTALVAPNATAPVVYSETHLVRLKRRGGFAAAHAARGGFSRGVSAHAYSGHFGTPMPGTGYHSNTIYYFGGGHYYNGYYYNDCYYHNMYQVNHKVIMMYVWILGNGFWGMFVTLPFSFAISYLDCSDTFAKIGHGFAKLFNGYFWTKGLWKFLKDMFTRKRKGEKVQFMKISTGANFGDDITEIDNDGVRRAPASRGGTTPNRSPYGPRRNKRRTGEHCGEWIALLAVVGHMLMFVAGIFMIMFGVF